INKTFLRGKNQLSDGDEEDSPALGVKPFDLHDLSSAGWKAGDQLAVPGKRKRKWKKLNFFLLDSRFLDSTTLTQWDVVKRGHIEHVQVASVAGDTLTLQSPGLVYGHPGQRNMTDEWD